MLDKDEELLLKWQQGNAGAIEALVQRYHAPLLAYFFHLVRDAHLAEDFVQDVFIRLLQDKHPYQYPRPFKPWIYTIARRLALNFFQSAQYRREETRADFLGFSESISYSDEWLEQIEQRDGLRQALSLLSFEQREVLSLRFGAELSIQEAATILGISQGTVKSRTFTALRLLRNNLSRQVQPTKHQYLSGEKTHG